MHIDQDLSKELQTNKQTKQQQQHKNSSGNNKKTRENK